MTSPHRILIIRPSALGDVCRTVPVLASLKRAYPSAEIDWLVQDSFAPAIAAHPDLTQVVSFPRGKLREWYRPSVAPALKRFLDSLGERRYDLVLDCQGLFRSGLFAMATKAPRRIGFDNAAELGWLGLTERIHAPRSMHAVDRMLMLAHAAGAEPVYDMRLYTAPEDRAWIDARPELASGCAVIAPTTRWAGKQWPMERFASLARRLLAGELGRPISRIAVVGSPSERDQCAELLLLAGSEPRIVDLVGRTTVGQLLALIERCPLLIGCDSAAVHMAVGFDRPFVALYGPTRVERVGPYGRSSHVVQRLIPGDSRDHKDDAAGQVLMRRITVEDVLECARAQGDPTPGFVPVSG
ncbi:MAG TPA: glycosyltransferase family 9 protein [Phycisphaerales bacterium]|jgi:lipopolysaccharide heptosyltransferase I|nr:glycosyltransferase family 9 protein [Phycisphaerales bacterium]